MKMTLPWFCSAVTTT
jgi:hypothetical protein